MAYDNWTASPTSPARRIEAVVPDDGADLPVPAKALRIWNPGDAEATVSLVAVGAPEGAPATAIPVPPGLSVEPLMVRRVAAAGTDGALTIHAYVD